MFASRFTALLDACVVAGALKRNVLLSLAAADFFRPRWSARILSETEAAIARMLADKGASDAQAVARRQIAAMEAAFADARVEDYERLIPRFEGLPDANDAHVIAAAVSAQASVIVTDNLRDFPAQTIRSHGIEAKSADTFIANTLDLDMGRGVAALRAMRLRLKRPFHDADDLLLKFEAHGLVESADLLRPWIDQL